jgi:hypothetical protein
VKRGSSGALRAERDRGRGEKILSPRPGSLGVVPVRGSLKPEHIGREPHLDIDAHFELHERFLVIPCVCKREMELLHGKSCNKPMKRCGFVGLPPQTPLGETVLDREEASALLGRFEKMGRVHLAFYGFTKHVCNILDGMDLGTREK